MRHDVTAGDVELVLTCDDAGQARRLLEELLSLPTRDMGPGGTWVPDQAIADLVGGRGRPDADATRLARLASDVAGDRSRLVVHGRATPDDVEMLCRLAFLATALALRVRPDPYREAATALAGTGTRREEARLFGILRGASRLSSDVATPEDVVWWTGWLGHPLRSVRTLAAQRLVRSVEARNLTATMTRVLSLDLHLGMTCFEWLRRSDVSVDVVGAAVGLDADLRSALERGLREVGEDAAADVVRSSSAS